MSEVKCSEAYLQKYYQVFLDFLQVVGAHQSILKLSQNADNGVYPTQKVARDYGYEGAKLDAAIHDRDIERWNKLEELNHWSAKTGLGRMNSEGMERLLKFAEDYDRRRYLKDNIKRAIKKGELLSVRDLMLKRFNLEMKKGKITKIVDQKIDQK
ncbi:hypothetical protein IJG93_04240 [Candidatus Saccharibacteria bacterium]|nr:hypothetical protein [Candidatus Saccharibacteria bacterium]